MRVVGNLGRVVPVVLALVVLAAPARAGDDAAALEGTWKRTKVVKPGEDAGEPLFVQLAWDATTGELKGSIVNPPQNDPPFKVDVKLTRKGNALEGPTTWHEKEWSTDCAWQLEIKSDDRLEGRCEWKEWEEGKVYDSGWDQHVFTRVERESLGTGAAPAKVESTGSVDAKLLEGGIWRNPASGGLWVFKEEGGEIKICSPDGKPSPGNENVSVRIENNLVVGHEKQADGSDHVLFELGLTADGKLAGRASWRDKDGPKSTGPAAGWSGFAREKLPRIDAPPASLEKKPVVPYGGAPEPLANMRRADGLYLKLTPNGAGYKGELVTKDGESRGTVELAPEGNVWAGTAQVKTADGGTASLKWEIGAADDKGTHVAAIECGDYDPAKKEVIRRERVEGWTFLKLRRIE